MAKFKTQWNADAFPEPKGETNNLPSLTIPDQSLSVRDLMERQSRGLSLSGVKVPIYHGEDEFLPEYKNLDLSEREDLKRANQDEIREMKSLLQKQFNEKQTSVVSDKDYTKKADAVTKPTGKKDVKNDDSEL